MPRPEIAALIAVALAPIPADAAPASVASGAYDNTLLVAVDPASGAVTGYFQMTQGETFSCIFYVKGRLAGAAAAVETYFPDDPKDDVIRGLLTPQGAGKVRLALPDEHGGCGNVWQFADKSHPADFELQHAEPWTSVRVIKADKAYFYPGPGAAAHGRAYLVKGDGVGVRASQPGWVQADFVGESRTSSGWLKVSDLYAP